MKLIASSVCGGPRGAVLCWLLVGVLPGCGGEGPDDETVVPVGEELGAMQEQPEPKTDVAPDGDGTDTPTPATEPGTPMPRAEDEAAVGGGDSNSPDGEVAEPGVQVQAQPLDEDTDTTEDGPAEQAELQPPVASESEPPAPSESNTPPMPSDDPEPAGGPSFSAVFEQVFEGQGCTTGYCHGGGAGELSFADAVMTYEVLVDGRASKESCGLTTWVVPGDPEASILWYRVRPPELEEGEPCVTKMPNGSDGLPAEQAQLIYDWILGGALP